MNSEKRLRNPPKPFVFQYNNRIHKHKPLEKKQKLLRDNYEIIGLPPKYLPLNDIYLLPGNIPFSQKNDGFITELSWLNEFHVFREVEFLDSDGEKSLVIHVERRTDSRFPRLKNFMDKLLKTRNSEVRSWGKVLKRFCQTCKNTRTSFNPQKPFEVKEEEEVFSCPASETQSLINKEVATIKFQSYFRGSESHLTQIIVNEKFIQTFGFTPDTFCSLIFTEGLPEIFEVQNENNSDFLYRILEELNMTDKSHKKTSLIEATIKTKSGYIKQVKVQADLKIDFKNDRFESNLSFHIISQNTPCHLSDNLQTINENFLQAIKQTERQAKEFIQTFYNSSILLTYTSQDQMCKIKEI